MGVMRRAVARDREEYARREELARQAQQDRNQARATDRFASTLVIAASIIAAVRLAREPEIGQGSPRVHATVAESISLARMILEKILG